MSDLRSTIRQAHKAGSWVYAIVETIGLGYASVRIASNGGRLSNLPVTGGELRPGDACVVDYSAGVPPTVRPIKMQREEEEELMLAPVLPENPVVPLEEDAETDWPFFIAGDHGVNVYQFGGTLTNSIRGAETPVRFSHTDWDTEADTDWPFFDAQYPYYVTIPSDGYYYCIATIGWFPPPESEAKGQTGDTPPLWNWYSIDEYHKLDITITGSTYGTIGWNRDYPIGRSVTAYKIFQAYGQAPLEAGEHVSVTVTHWHKTYTSHTLYQEYKLCPNLIVQWIGPT